MHFLKNMLLLRLRSLAMPTCGLTLGCKCYGKENERCRNCEYVRRSSSAGQCWRWIRLYLVRIMQIRGTYQRCRDAWANILRSHMSRKLGLFHQLGGLFACATQEQLASRSVEPVR